MITPTLKSAVVVAVGLVPAGMILLNPLDTSAQALWVGALIITGVVHLIDLSLLTPRRSMRFSVDAPELLYLGDENDESDESSESDGSDVRGARDVRFSFDHRDLRRDLSGEGHLSLAGGDPLEIRPQQFTLAARDSSQRSTALSFTLTPRRRGTLTVHALTLRWLSPLGLIRETWSIPLSHTISVIPNSRAVRAVALRLKRQQSGVHGMRPQTLLGEGSEFEQLKEYSQGLDHRAIDWRASARHTKLLVRSFRAEMDHQIYLAFDTGRLMSAPLDDLSRLDRVINAGLILSYLSLRCGDQVGLYGFSDQVELFTSPRRGVRSFPFIEAQLAELTYHQAETNFTLGALELMKRLKRRSLIVLFTDFMDSTAAELKLESLLLIARRHRVIFVSFKDPALERLSRQAPASPSKLHESVLALNVLADRARVFKRLSRLGVRHLEVDAETITPRLLDEYLTVKRRELV